MATRSWIQIFLLEQRHIHPRVSRACSRSLKMSSAQRRKPVLGITTLQLTRERMLLIKRQKHKNLLRSIKSLSRSQQLPLLRPGSKTVLESLFWTDTKRQRMQENKSSQPHSHLFWRESPLLKCLKQLLSRLLVPPAQQEDLQQLASSLLWDSPLWFPRSLLE